MPITSRDVVSRHDGAYLMSREKKKMSREFRVIITVEEVEAPKVAETSVEDDNWSKEAAEFLDESDYTK
jgi:hypothetical protein